LSLRITENFITSLTARVTDLLVVDLKNALVEALTETVKEESSVAVAFSGGIDSSLLAQLCNNLGYKVTLLTVGFPGSQDIEFSKVIAPKLGLQHKLLEIHWEDFNNNYEYIGKKISCGNISHIENCLAFYYLGLLAQQNASRLILTANGCDELFCGYDRFRSVYEFGDARIFEFIHEKIENEITLMQEVKSITTGLGVKIMHPFLSEKFSSIAMNIPIDDKIKGCDDFLRKHILREVALMIGVPREAATKPKKAMQYGSLIHKNFKAMKTWRAVNIHL
jgi:asparagine synthase (glutamine-hydrolysing)